MAKTIPPRLYKYQSLTPDPQTHKIYALENLQQRQIWFSKPEKLNDPFDCNIPFLLKKRVTENEWEKGYKGLIRRMQNELPPDKLTTALKTAEERYLTNRKINQRFKDEMIGVNNNNIGNKQQQEFKNYGVACFSEDFDNILMWSHYADGHKGLCLEFDTNYIPFDDVSKVHHVKYRNAYPVISPVAFLTEPIESLTPLITKSEEWCYENEWRIILQQPERTEFIYDPKALTAIYFGCSMLKEDIHSKNM